MQLSHKSKFQGDIDVTSFADLAFLLIIFFILTTTFTRPEGARTTIPSSTSNPENKSEEEVPAINLSREKMLFKKNEVTIDELRSELMKMNLPEKEEDKRIVILDSTPDVTFQRYFHVVTAISKAGGILALIETTEESSAKTPVEDKKP